MPHVYGESKVPQCYEQKTYPEAEAICEANSITDASGNTHRGRLCTAAELEADCTKETGCGHDNDLVWANREPAFQPYGTYHTQFETTFGPSGTYRDGSALNGRMPEAVCAKSAVCTEEEGLQARDALHEVRCCADKDLTEAGATQSKTWQQCANNVYAESEVPTCFHSKTYTEAEAICEADGARLCTKSEIAQGCGVGTGCRHDRDLIWTRN
jgi:hypothetical protein